MLKPKILAMYLPQFHEIPENNEWWGKGFTEWTSLRNSKSLFPGHMQPRVPYKENYYNLIETDTLRHQAGLMEKYGVDGMCFYHYWFTGKKLLEKPAELLLANSDIPMNFCFSWANQTWSRTWYGAKKEVLLEQKYGTEKDWKIHFDYLVPFFQDNRYIKLDNTPVLVIYRPFEILCYDEMIAFFKEEAKKLGFNGVHIIESLTTNQTDIQSEKSDGCFYYEPWYTLFGSKESFIRNRIYAMKKYMSKYFFSCRWFLNIFDYDAIYNEILERNLTGAKFRGKKVNVGCFVDLDDTPRRKELGILFKHVSPNKFKGYFKKIYDKAISIQSDFIFITAWNEWAEGAHLEPDETHGYGYLEAIRDIKEKYTNK